MITKRAARAVIVDGNKLLALISVRDGEYYKIPGGGIEEGESEETAARREAREEAGCEINILREIGRQEFRDNNPDFGETLHQSVCFLAEKVGVDNEVNFDDWERSNRMKLIWVDFPEAIRLFSKVTTNDFFGREISKRDYAFVLRAKEVLGL